MGRSGVKPRMLPEKRQETRGQKAARTKHGKAALKFQLEAAKRMLKAQLSLNQITGIVGETWAVANLSMLSTNSATAPFDGWLPDGRTLEVKCRYAPKGSGSLTLNSRHKDCVDLLLALEIDADITIRQVYFDSFARALEAASRRRSDGKASLAWSRLSAL